MLALVTAILFVRAASAGPVLESVADVRAVGSWAPAEPHPISLRAVVTMVDQQRGLLVVQDGREVLALDMGRAKITVSPGQRVLIKAVDSWPALAEVPRYPLDPDRSEWLDSFEWRARAPHGFYIARFRGWVHPPVSGTYHFNIASDDSSQLLLGTGAAPQTGRAIARVVSYSDERDWLRTPWQRSQPIELEGGRAYYIEAVHQQAGGEHHLSVAWEGPDIPLQVIPGRYLTPWNADFAEARRDRTAGGTAAPAVGQILREVWEDLTVDNPVVLIAPRKLLTSLSVHVPRVETLEPAPWPEPATVQIGQAVAPYENFRWSRVEGTLTHLTRLENRVVLELADGAKRLEVVITDSKKQLPDHLRGRRVRIEGAGEALWEGDQMILGRLWLPSTDALTLLQEPPNVEFSRATTVHELNRGEDPLPDGTAVRVVGRVVQQEGTRVILRDSGTFRAFTSRDGVDWQQLGPTIDVEMQDTALVGFAVNSRSSEKASEVVFTDVAGLPKEIRVVDVGEPRRPGSLALRDGRYEIQGVGSDIWNTPDQFTFIHAPLEGDGAIVARVDSLQLADPAARAGIMFRESLFPYAPIVQLVHSAYSGRLTASAQWRGLAVGRSQHAVDHPHPTASPPPWLKLERRTSQLVVHAKTQSTVSPGELVEVAGYVAAEAAGRIVVDAAIRPLRAKHEAAATGGPWRPSAEIASLLDDSRKWGGFDFFRIRGVVTFSGEVAGRRYWTMQDVSGAVSLQGRDPSKLFQVPAGTLVEVYSNPGWFPPTNTLFADNVFRLGEAAFPKPIKHPAQYLLPRRGEGTWIELEGVVRSASADGQLVVKTKGELFTVAVPGATRGQLQPFVDGGVRIRGAIVFPSEEERLLLVPSLQHIELLQPPAADPFGQTPSTTRELAADALLNESRHRTRVSGRVTLASPSLIFVQDEFGGAQVELTAAAPVSIGTEVDVVGFPDAGTAGGVVLRHALVRALGKPSEVEARDFNPAAPGEGAVGTFQLRRIQATVTQVDGDWLELDADGKLVRAARPVNGDAIPSLPTGSRVEVTGVYVPSNARFPWVRPSERQSLQASPQLLTRTARDIDVLSTPAWWALRRTLIGAGLFAVIIGGGFVWIQVLRRRVRQRSAELAATMKKLEEEVRMSATLAERDRLAGEIHDTVEQGLNGLVMHLETAAELRTCSPEVRSELLLARNMAAFSRTEVKHAIWELQSPLLNDSNLPQALQKVVSQIVPESLKVTVVAKGSPRRLTSAIEHHLLRLAQEAVNNTIKHARANSVSVELTYEPDAVVLTVQDDGCGFDPTSRNLARLGHFGLISMRNRANKILAELDIVSSPGHGTRVRVRVPTTQTDNPR